ncbi:5'-nucleotidase [Halothece sp. PCC 7418]|uniref:5'/3'-nucleotidase SurE n=1 Tax=Halothece sp. (strain PCC 7418) TaxID=65093 RepID=UPI0002A06788|nr:5'/3'-nucleotidase SurE [Halothece sp. PCC 7418]AFZ42635.1 5'-nucleotidase [Halothece sp. PCC 7418]
MILTNDDGFQAPGIKALQTAIPEQGIIIAPETELSGCGHQVTTKRGLKLQQHSQQIYSVDGTPADCVRIGLTQLFPDAEWVISGINAGGNLGADVYISGTVAAVREAVFLGKKGIAISHWRKRPLEINWNLAARWSAQVLEKLFTLPLPEGSYWNVNLPHLDPDSEDPEIVFCEGGKQPLPVVYYFDGERYHYQGEYGKRQRQKGSDVDICFSGHIAVSQLKL